MLKLLFQFTSTMLFLRNLKQEVIFIRENIKFLFVFILPVYFFIVQNSVQNKHTHFYRNGFVVTHSHPLDSGKGQPLQNHEHSKIEICFFSQVNFDFFSFTPELIFKPHVTPANTNFFIRDENARDFSFILHPFQRGPPISFFHSLRHLA